MNKKLAKWVRTILVLCVLVGLGAGVVMWRLGVRPAHFVLLFYRPVDLSPGQDAEVQAWMQDNAVCLKTLDLGSGFEDMQPLKAMIGDASIVALGEQRHVVRDFHRANRRMIEFLVSEMGFTVFAIEASFPGAHAINDYIIDGKGTAERALASLVYRAWTTETMLGMIEWMREYNATHEKKVKFYGVDDRPAETSAQAVWAYLRKIDGTTEYDGVLSVMMNPWTAKDLARGPREEKLDAMEKVKGLITYLEDRKPAEGLREQKEWSLVVQHARLLFQNLEFWHAMPARSISTDIRDKHMGENVRWIRDYEDGAKMIVWAANPHIGAMRGSGTMGDHLRRVYGDDIFVMGLICNRIIDPSEAESAGPPPVTMGTMEGAFVRAGLDMAVIDLRSLPKGIVGKYLSSPLKTGGTMTLFPKTFDAVMFIELTSNAKMLVPEFPGNPLTLAAPSNLGFEESANGVPKDWALRGKRSLLQYETAVSGDNPYEGNSSCVIRKRSGHCFGDACGVIHQEIEAGDFQGKTIELVAAARVDDGIAHVWLSVDARKGVNVFVQEEITSDEWRRYHISADVPEDAKKITYGLAYFGKGAAYLDAVSVVQPN